MSRPLAVLHWSGGKDAAQALYRLQQPDAACQVATLFTTLGEEQRRITMHGVHESLLLAQAEAIGLPLTRLYLPTGVDMPTYSKRMNQQWQEFVDQGIQQAVFGDIHLDDLRAYREQSLSKVALKPIFPLWKEPAKDLAQSFLDLGFKAVVVAVNARTLGPHFAGRKYDAAFLADLPASVDPCGENGEFHTFVYDGPIFRQPVAFELGQVVHRHYPDEGEDLPYDTGFYFQELLLC